MLEKLSKYQNLAYEIYGKDTWRQKRRAILFWPRAYKNAEQMEGTQHFFDHYIARPCMLRDHLYLYEIDCKMYCNK